jgi:hypothetical protein
MAKYRVQDEGSSDDFDAADDDAAVAYGKQWLCDGSWDRDQTLWLRAYVFRLQEDGEGYEMIGTARATLHPIMPKCVGEEHVWCSPYHILGGMKENPGVWGNGGGARIKEVCSECGVYRVTDTWATNPCDGTQGHTSVEYLPANAASSEWVQQLGRPEEVSDG